MAQLQAAGFDITAHEWYRLELALSRHQQLLQSPEGMEELGLILGPLLCKNDKQQEVFRQVYQKYLNELPRGGRTVVEEVQAPKSARWWLPALLALGLLLISIPLLDWYNENYGAARNFERFDYEYDLGEGRFEAGDTIRLINRTAPGDTAGLKFYWYIKNSGRTEVVQRHVGYDNPAWVFDNPAEGDDHWVQLIVRQRGDSLSQVFAGREESFRVYCTDAPEITGLIEVEGEHLPGEPLQFSVEASGTDLEYRWTINGTEIVAPTPTYTFEEPETYSIRVMVRDTSGKAGRCYDEISYQLEIKDDSPKPVLVSMPPLTLQKDSEAIEYLLPVWLIALLGMLPALAVPLWTIWYYQRKNYQQKKKAARAAKLAAIQVNDKAPYEIPFESRKSEISKSALQFNMANVLRRRQEGTRQMLDVPQTIRHTVEGGGYLDLQFRYNTRPTDYLFLIDQASAESHQARLFVYLTETLRDQDVHVDYWTYRTDFDGFWNPGYEGYLNLDQLYKAYNDRKLIVFGNADTLLDRHRAKDTLDTFGRWKYRLLVTPRPLASWGSKEKRLYQTFPIFPANLQSLMEAVRLIESEWEPEDLPAYFRDWQAQLERKMPEDPDSEQRWRKWPQYKAYLRQHPELLPWLKALVVHPDLRWDLTIAIGKALDAPVTFDNLLILSRIPDFEQGAFPVRVWRDIWPQLDLEQEWTARRRVKAELEAISAEAVQDSYAEQSLQTDLALQDFALEPYNKDHQEAIRLRLETGQIDKLRLEELDQIVERQTDTEVPDDAGRGDRTDAFLRKQETKEKAPVLTPLFWWAAALSLVSLLAWTALIGLDWQAVGEYFMDKDGKLPFYMNSSQAEFRRLNNEAVANLYPNDIAPEKADILEDGPRSIELLQQALGLRPDYILAQDNLEKLYYLTGKEYYRDIVNDNDLEQAAYDNFQRALTGPAVRPTRDSTDFFAFHGLASIQHTLLRPDSACVYLDSLRTHFPELLLEYAGNLLYLDGCEQEEETPFEQEQATQPEEENFYGEQFLFVFAGDVSPPAAENQGLQVIQSMANLASGATALNWIADYNRANDPDLIYYNIVNQQAPERAFEINPSPGPAAENNALIVTTSSYSNTPDLSYPLLNGTELATILRGFNYQVERVPELSDLELSTRLQYYQEISFGENDQLFIYYAGYAYNEGGQTFILSRSAAADRTTFRQEQSSPAPAGINLNEIRNIINEIPCPRIMLLLDLAELPDQPVSNSEQNTTHPELPQDNLAQLTLSLGGRERSTVTGFIIDEFEGDLIIAAPYTPLSENDTKLYGPDYTVQLNGTERTENAELIEAYEQDLLAYFRLPKPRDFSWNFEDLYDGEDMAGSSLSGYNLREPFQEEDDPVPLSIQVDIEGKLEAEAINETRSDDVWIRRPLLGPNLLYVNNKIAGLLTQRGSTVPLYWGLSFDFIQAIWENTLSVYINQQVNPEPVKTNPLLLPPDFPLPEMVSIQGGTFTMGCTEGIREIVGDDCDDDETPHQVRLDAYQMATTEVTFAQYDAFCAATGWDKPGDQGWGRGNRPVINIDWYDAIEFCNWLSLATGRTPVYTIDGKTVTPNWQANGYRLPTEAEWEYAARERGRDVVFGNGKNIADPAEINFLGSADYKTDYSVVGAYRRQTVPVASLNSPNALGLHDLSGNVWEWCWDGYGDYPQTDKVAVSNPKGNSEGFNRVLRGGSWNYNPVGCRAADRLRFDPFVRNFDIGFRLVRHAP
jgi:formylglycine-generating enzyme required for sulfatase activity/type II secretory pathway pseudopilin PulG